MVFDILDTRITTANILKYLGVRFDSRLKFTHQINHVADKAGKVIGMLSKLMANVGGPTQLKRKLLMDTTNSVLLYGSEVWGTYLRTQNRRNILLTTQRTSALRVASAYRTVSQEAVFIISSTIPIDLLIEERVRIYAERKQGNEVDKRELRMETLRKLQEKWNSSVKGKWTAKLIPRIAEWFNRKEGEVNYYLTQMLSGHGYYRKYLFRIGKADDPSCVYGDGAIDDAEHTLFNCERWKNERKELEKAIGRITVENIVSKMLRGNENWQKVAKYAENVLKMKKIDLDRGLPLTAWTQAIE